MKKNGIEKENAQIFFQDNNYIIISEAISKDVVGFIYNYFQVKRDAAKILLDTKNISPFDESWGSWKDAQNPNTFSIYGDVAMDTLMIRILPLVQKITKMSLISTYSYATMCKHGEDSVRYNDSVASEIACIINLGGDNWPIFLEHSEEKNKESIEVNLNPGDLLVYKVSLIEYWRNSFEGNDCGQVFCHYNNANSSQETVNKFDTRPSIGLPAWMKK